MNLVIDGKNIDFFNRFNLNLRYDAVASTFNFEFYFDPDNEEHRSLLGPKGYRQCKVYHNNELLVTGTIIANGYGNAPVSQLCTMGGYSLPGILEDCEIPPGIYPLQSDGLTLRQIATKICNAFGIRIKVDAGIDNLMDRVINTSTAKETQAAKSYITTLAAQLNITLSHTAAGELLFTRAATKQAPVFHLNNTQGSIPGTELKLSCNWQAMHETITIMKQADADGGNAGQSNITNPYATGSRRTRVKTQSSGDDNTTYAAARNALSEELRNIKLSITTSTWLYQSRILRPNSIIAVTDPQLGLNKKTLWFVESIDFAGTQESTTAVLNCILPEVYNNNKVTPIFT